MTQRAALVLTAAFVVVAAAACGSGSTPSAQPANSQAVSDSDFARIPGQLPAQPPGVPGAAMAPVGACVSLTGRSTSASLKLVDCSSPSNGYMVVQRVATPEQCVRDVDQKFYMNLEEGQFTACLDYAWRADDCLSIAKLAASRVQEHRESGKAYPCHLELGLGLRLPIGWFSPSRATLHHLHRDAEIAAQWPRSGGRARRTGGGGRLAKLAA
ncbi:LppU/SCO3897 family protein [Mycolicibacterium porcinum]|uniref:LppU/SCO3897 family protein n=1 Tax=Mycolicibacterium porcinum TaxID=39693 RepID=UPI0026BA9A97